MNWVTKVIPRAWGFLSRVGGRGLWEGDEWVVVMLGAVGDEKDD